MMRRLLLALFAAATATSAFTARQPSAQADVTTLNMLSRRNAMLAVVVSLVLPQAANAFSQQLDDHQWEPQQQATDGRLDLNSAFVGEYKNLRGMFPNAAGKIASNGPYAEVSDIYNIPDLSDHDIEMFKKYQRFFIVNPPGRTFYERIKGRVST